MRSPHPGCGRGVTCRDGEGEGRDQNTRPLSVQVYTEAPCLAVNQGWAGGHFVTLWFVPADRDTEHNGHLPAQHIAISRTIRFQIFNANKKSYLSVLWDLAREGEGTSGFQGPELIFISIPRFISEQGG